jgi:hypothetical protein
VVSEGWRVTRSQQNGPPPPRVVRGGGGRTHYSLLIPDLRHPREVRGEFAGPIGTSRTPLFPGQTGQPMPRGPETPASPRAASLLRLDSKFSSRKLSRHPLAHHARGWRADALQEFVTHSYAGGIGVGGGCGTGGRGGGSCGPGFGGSGCGSGRGNGHVFNTVFLLSINYTPSPPRILQRGTAPSLCQSTITEGERDIPHRRARHAPSAQKDNADSHEPSHIHVEWLV